MKRRIDGSVIVITGASSGIGRALAQVLAARGAKLVLAARRIKRLRRLTRSLGNLHVCVETDVSDPPQCRALIEEAIARFRRIDTLVCNAGYGMIRPAAQTPPDEFQRLFRTNVIGTSECIRAAVPHMLRQDDVGDARGGWRGQIVIVSSAAARRGLPMFGAYTATKAAQLSLAEALRVELAPARIAVTSVHPVGTSTEFFRTAARLSRALPPRRGALESRQTPRQVALAIVRAIERPRPEVWPMGAFRWLMSLATLAPSIVDRILKERGEPATIDEEGIAAVAAHREETGPSEMQPGLGRAECATAPL